MSGRSGPVSAWMRDADGDHVGSGLRAYCFEIFPCEYIRRDSGDQSVIGGVSAGAVYSDGRRERGEYGRILGI